MFQTTDLHAAAATPSHVIPERSSVRERDGARNGRKTTQRRGYHSRSYDYVPYTGRHREKYGFRTTHGRRRCCGSFLFQIPTLPPFSHRHAIRQRSVGTSGRRVRMPLTQAPSAWRRRGLDHAGQSGVLAVHGRYRHLHRCRRFRHRVHLRHHPQHHPDRSRRNHLITACLGLFCPAGRYCSQSRLLERGTSTEKPTLLWFILHPIICSGFLSDNES